MNTPDVFEIRPRRTRDGFGLSGPLGGSGVHWFRTVAEAARYAKLTAGMTRKGGILRVYRADRTLRAERILAGDERGGTLGTGG